MNAIILAAGRGTRLLPLTKELPKTLISVCGKSILEHILDRVIDVGIKEIIIVTGFNDKKIMAAVNKRYDGVKIKFVFNQDFEKTNSIYSLLLTRDVAGDEFIVINGDTIFDKRILRELIKSDHEIAMAIDETKIDIREEGMKVTIHEGKIVDASKKISKENTHGDAIGLYKFGKEGSGKLFNKIQELVGQNVVNELFTFAVKQLMPHEKVMPVYTGGKHWVEIDYLKDLTDAETIIPKIVEGESNGTIN